MNRIIEALRSIVAELTAPMLYHAIVRYRVVQHGSITGRMTLQAVKAGPWPDLLAIGAVTGLPGGYAQLQLGAVIYVAFAEGDPSLPIVLAGPRSDDPAALPTATSLDASGNMTIGASSSLVQLGSGSEMPSDATGRVIRYGDSVSVPGVGVVVFGVGAAPVSKVGA